jgi:hypothetical protein
MWQIYFYRALVKEPAQSAPSSRPPSFEVDAADQRSECELARTRPANRPEPNRWPPAGCWDGAAPGRRRPCRSGGFGLGQAAPSPSGRAAAGGSKVGRGSSRPPPPKPPPPPHLPAGGGGDHAADARNLPQDFHRKTPR